MRTKALTLAFAGLLAAAVPAAGFAGGARVGVTIGIGGPPVVYYPPPPVVYYPPPPVVYYSPPPVVYYPPPPVVYYPSPPAVVFHVGGHFGGRRHGGWNDGYRHAGHRGWH